MTRLFVIHDEDTPDFILYYGEKQVIEFANCRLTETDLSDRLLYDTDYISEELKSALEQFRDNLTEIKDLDMALDLVKHDGWYVEEVEIY